LRHHSHTDTPGGFAWSPAALAGRLGVTRVVDAEHVFTLTSRDDGGVTLCQAEEFTGVLVPSWRVSLDRHTLPAFVTMNEALKVRAEQAMASRHG
jgi:hypothetical protein